MTQQPPFGSPGTGAPGFGPPPGAGAGTGGAGWPGPGGAPAPHGNGNPFAAAAAARPPSAPPSAPMPVIAPDGPDQQVTSWGGPGSAAAPPWGAPAAPGGPVGGPSAPRRGPSPVLWVVLSLGLVVLLAGGAVVAELMARSNAAAALDAKAAAIKIERGDGPTTGFTVEHPDGIALFRSAYDELVFTSGSGAATTFTVTGQPTDLALPAAQIDVTGPIDDDTVIDALELADGPLRDFATTLEVTHDEDGMRFTFSEPSIPNVEVTGLVRMTATSGDIVAQVTDLQLLDGGVVVDRFLDEDPVLIDLCAGVDGATGELSTLTTDADGITGSWSVTGEGATLDNLSAVGACA